MLSEDYNGSIFGKNEDDRHFSENLTISDKTIKTILKELYDDSPYDFSIIPIDILGAIYEKFLGKIVKVVPSGKVDVIQKDEVRKAGGVYYTPKYIVDYIVEQTVGDKIKGKTPNQISKIKVLDMACGSGTFLIGAFERIIKEHEDYYLSKYKQNDLSSQHKDWILIKEIITEINDSTGDSEEKENLKIVLSVSKKSEILLNNIFGLDIDNQAVEVTKMSLYFTLLEDENYETKQQYLTGFSTRMLPKLDSNIKNGNSLIDWNIKNETEINKLNNTEKIDTIKSINPFNWDENFSEIIKDGGFDVIIGNPPYIKIQSLFEFQPFSVPFLKKIYRSAKSKNIDIYLSFIEKALTLLKSKGYLGYILPYKFFHEDMGENLREIISQKKALRKIINFKANQVFKDATTYTCLFFLENNNRKNFEYFEFDLDDLFYQKLYNIPIEIKNIKESVNSKWHFTLKIKSDIIEKIKNHSQLNLKNITRKIFVGIQTSADNIYVLEKIDESNGEEGKIILFSKSLNKNITIEKALVKPFLFGKNVKRYQMAEFNNYVLFPYLIEDGKATIMPKKYIKENFPEGWNFILDNKNALENRENGKMKIPNFYAYIYPKNLVDFENKKLMTPDITDTCNFTIDEEGNLYHTTTIYSLAFNEKAVLDIHFYLGLLNSNIFKFFIYNTGTILRGGFTRFKPQYMNDFPIPTLDLSNPEEKKFHDEIVSQVSQLIEIKKLIKNQRSEREIQFNENLIGNIESDINNKIFKIYDLTEKEIKIVNK